MNKFHKVHVRGVINKFRKKIGGTLEVSALIFFKLYLIFIPDYFLNQLILIISCNNCKKRSPEVYQLCLSQQKKIRMIPNLIQHSLF